ncbi:extracellular matrix/biofilm biosynthesis regulator RemA family protein [Aggregatilinea lenta]|uniref:extracellular matrix/biofilm biosynthesis regulator RemA family protein n=1 Tax=Aggregatilinea lenta TaxID=913108 RepID=UPI000E5B02A5|nr:extracellular matrix/biofilm biosynthesis regulator RemA family protein [Aggregatilinea lenta]
MGAGWVVVGQGGVIATERIVAVANARSAPVKRWIENTDPARIINLTYGYPRRAVLLLDNDYLIIVPVRPEELVRLLKGDHHDESG